MALKNWTLFTVPASQEADLVTPDANKEVAVIGLCICNNEATNSAAIQVKLVTSGNTPKAMVWRGTLLAGESVHVDTKVTIESSNTPDKIRVISDKANTSFLASGDAS